MSFSKGYKTACRFGLQKQKNVAIARGSCFATQALKLTTETSKSGQNLPLIRTGHSVFRVEASKPLCPVFVMNWAFPQYPSYAEGIPQMMPMGPSVGGAT